MSLLNIDTARREVLQFLASVEAPGGIEILSYKRNRGIAVLCRSPNRFLVREQGYVDQEKEVDGEGLARVLKTMIKREFPRSRKVRLIRISHPDELDRPRQKI